MGNRFTEKAEKALNNAVKIAENHGHTYIGSEHILLGLLSDSKMVSASILAVKKVTLKRNTNMVAKANAAKTAVRVNRLVADKDCPRLDRNIVCSPFVGGIYLFSSGL